MAAQVEEIKDMTTPRLFHGLSRWKKTGTAVFERENAVKKIYFQEGDVIFASSNLEDDRLGECLLRNGAINQQAYDVSAELVKKTGKKQGAILVDLGFLTPQGLIEGVKNQVKHIILSLFLWRDGRYSFDEGPLPLTHIIPLDMSTGNLIIEGVKGLEWKVIRKALPPLNTVLRPASDPAALFQNADLSHDQRIILSLIDGKRSMEELCTLSGAGDFNTLRAVYLFLSLSIVETGEIKSEREMTYAREALQEAVERKAAGEAPPSEIKKSIKEAFDNLGGMDHYHVLGIKEDSTAAEIKKAYFRLAKMYHPDRHFEPEMSDMKQELEALFARITNAYDILSEKAERDEYDLLRARRGKTVELEEDHTNKTANAHNQFNIGLREYKSGNYWGAVEAFTWASRLDSSIAKYHYYRGLALSQMPRRRHEAEDSLKKAVEMEPSRAEYHVELGNLYLKGGLKSRAYEIFKSALDWDPDSEQAKMGLIAAGGEEVEKKGGGIIGKLFKEKK